MPVEVNTAALEARIAQLEKIVAVASRFVNIGFCKSCNNPYAKGYICNCGRDNTYTDEEWES